jgi:predicted GNAT family acetyltransferase
MSSYQVTTAGPSDAEALGAFAAQRPLVWADFASVAALQPETPRVLIARAGPDGPIRAAAIDDGMAMSVGGDNDALAAIAAASADIDAKLVVAGRRSEVAQFIAAADTSVARRDRPEHFMAVSRAQLTMPFDPVPLRIATAEDLPMLITARVQALEEEYGVPVPAGSRIHTELEAAVTRAVGLSGVAIWTEDDACAFTAQLIAKTDDAAMFGDLYVDAALRGAGRATRALSTFCIWLMTESEHVTLRVGVDNDPAVRLYERVGFAVIDEFTTSLGGDLP